MGYLNHRVFLFLSVAEKDKDAATLQGAIVMIIYDFQKAER